MADNNKVTIDADYFAELYGCWQSMHDKTYCDRGICGKIIAERNKTEQAIKERDELKAKLDGDANANGLSPATMKLIETEQRLAEAERCIEDIWNLYNPTERSMKDASSVVKIIRAYREKKEAK